MYRSYIVVFILFYLVSGPVYSQAVDYNRVIIPSNVKDLTNEETLVQLAWQNQPSAKIVELESQNADINKRMASLQWIDIVGFTANLNEFTIRELSGEELNYNNYYPRYNIYFQLPFSYFYQIPLNKKSKRIDQKISYEKINLAKLNIRNRVLNLYNEYIRAESIYKMQFDFEELSKSNFLLAEEEFKIGTILIEDYYVIYKNYQQQRISKIDAEIAFKNAKNDLEFMIGVPLSEVLND